MGFILIVRSETLAITACYASTLIDEFVISGGMTAAKPSVRASIVSYFDVNMEHRDVSAGIALRRTRFV